MSVSVILPGVATTVSEPIVDEQRWSQRTASHLAKWRARADDTALGGVRRRYAGSRVAALQRPYSARSVGCGRKGVTLRCHCPGVRVIRPYGCRQHLTCEICRRRRAKRLGSRIRAGLETAIGAAPAGSMIVLVTLTVRHSGDVVSDRRALADGWRGLYQRMHRRGWGRFPYVGVWEVTPGADGLGHVHAHLAVVWPWRDWGEVRELWLDACPQSERITFVAGRRDGRASDPRSVANYLGKYLAKGVQERGFDPVLRADVCAAAYQSRWVFTSRRFWIPWVPLCPGCNCPRVSADYRWHGAPHPYERPYDPYCVRPDTPQTSLALHDL